MTEETTFTLLQVAVKTREIVQGHSGIYCCKIHIGRMSESEKTELESFVSRMNAHRGALSMSMVEGGKTVPGTREPLNTYEMYVYMTTLPCRMPLVDVCDLKFTYVAEEDMILAEITDVYSPSDTALVSLRGRNWFDAQPENQDEINKGLYETVPEIEKIEFNEPATIIFWKDGTKSVVKARDGEPYDAEKGIAMAIAKKALGNQRDYYNTFIHWLRRHKKKLNAAPREEYVTPQLELLEDRITEKPKKSSAKKKTASKKGGKK